MIRLTAKKTLLMIRRYVLIGLILLMQFAPGIAFGEDGDGSSSASGFFAKAGAELLGRACKVISYFYTGIIIVSVGCFMYAAWLFLTKGSSSGDTKGARNAALWAIVGLAIAMVAMGVPALLGDFLGVEGVSENPCATT